MRSRSCNHFRRSQFWLHCAVSTLLLFPSIAQLRAQNYFQEESGSWHNSSLWSTGEIPTASEEVFIGSSTPLTATISSGNAASGTAYIASMEGETGTVIVENDKSWSLESLFVSLGGTGVLRIQNGGKVYDTYGTVANDPASSGTAIITGTGSLWENSYYLSIGGNGNGALHVENGGKVTTFYGSIASYGTVGEAIVTGSGSLWENGGGLTIGGGGNGTLRVESGAKVSSGTDYDQTYLGYSDGSSGEATITGPGSLFETNGSLYVGNYGKGTLNIENGGKVTTQFQGLIGYFNEGAATVTGSNSNWTITEGLYVGNYRKGTLDIEAGGKVLSAFGVVGRIANQQGEALVTGSNSLWQNSTGLTIGEQGNGTLNIEAGGKVTVTGGDAIIAYFDGSTGVVTVTGSGSRMENRNTLWIGYGGDATLNVADGAVVTATNVRIGLDEGSKGTLNLIGSNTGRGVVQTRYASKEDTENGTIHFKGGVLRATQTQTNFLQGFNAGDVLIYDDGAYIDTNGFNVTISTHLRNAATQTGGLTKLGTGRLTLTGTSTYGGVTAIEQGSLRVSGRLSGGVSIKSNGTLDGTGTVGAVTIESGGIIAPGNSVGRLSTGSQTWTSGGIYLWEITAATGTAGTNWDLLEVNGKLTLGSTAVNPFKISLKGSLSGLSTGTEYAWTILTTTGGFETGFNTNKLAVDLTQFTGKPEGMTFFLDTSGNNLILKLSVVPEPGQIALVLMGLGVAILVGRRKTSASKRLPS